MNSQTFAHLIRLNTNPELLLFFVGCAGQSYCWLGEHERINKPARSYHGLARAIMLPA
jgi:hypothetical protein